MQALSDLSLRNKVLDNYFNAKILLQNDEELKNNLKFSFEKKLKKEIKIDELKSNKTKISLILAIPIIIILFLGNFIKVNLKLLLLLDLVK